MTRSGLLCGAAIVLASVAMTQAASAAGSFTTFDPKGSIATMATGINTAGTVTGYYNDSKGMTHGFVRTSDGTITTFDPKGSVATEALSINQNGEIAGWYRDKSGTFENFVRSASGSIMTFDPSKGSPLGAIGINANGMVTGSYQAGNGMAGYVGMPGGKLTKLTVQGVAINSKGEVTGVDGTQGFVRKPSGTTTTFAGPNSPNRTEPTSINNSGVVAGFDQTICGLSFGFARTPDGTVTQVDPAGTDYTQIYAINSSDTVAGTYYDGGYHGFVQESGGTYTSFDVPGASQGTYPQGINDSGTVAGWYRDGSSAPHGFVGTP
jgi:hypothetical protein